jgi:hypothetical protein
MQFLLIRRHPDGWRPSENVVYELGAASILYENRIVISKEKGVSFPTDFSDLGYIGFEKDQLVAELGTLSRSSSLSTSSRSGRRDSQAGRRPLATDAAT